ncbi:LCP family protein [Paenibacillus aquistagni]|uniref:Transcriptional attenuator, LytR family n=1 Tax=Paenibacillus aquistagni TaxID=1852522 RepID=A0A1X7I8E7_9BACL|nr:LCP family protein [Paenibacillus aquistagni]SMG10878.1 transcriptional attenuator, LytR family [Paenibacillus aquistagni]
MNRKRKRRKWSMIWLALIILITSGFAFRKPLSLWAYDHLLAKRVEQSLEQVYKPLDIDRPSLDLSEEPPFSLLLLGIDQRDQEVGRSDSMIYSVIRPKDHQVLLLSIPRDSYTEIIGKGKEDKIAHAYAFGGAEMSVNTVEHLLEQPVHHYASINFKGFRDVVDALGGVALPITEDIENKQWNHDKFFIPANKPLYTGLEALNYVRYREDTDQNRMERNQIFLQAITARALQWKQLSKIPTLLNIAGSNFQTDIPPSNMVDLGKLIFMRDEVPEFHSYALTGDGKMMDGIWYYMLDESTVEEAHQMIEDWLDPQMDIDTLLLPFKNKD